MNTGLIWGAPQRLARLKGMIAEGKSFAKIAAEFGDCSRSAVAGVVRRLRTYGPPKPPLPQYSSNAERCRAYRVRRKEKALPAWLKKKAAQPPPKVRAPGDPIPFQSYRYLIQCAWIMEEGDRFTPERIAVCGHATNGEVYCRFHAGLAVSAYQRPTGRVMSLGISMRARG